MKLLLDFEFKKFRGKNKPYSGFYTPTGTRTKRGKIEIDTTDSQMDQLDTVGHEMAHFIVDVFSSGRHSEDSEEQFAVALGRATVKLFKRWQDGKLT